MSTKLRLIFTELLERVAIGEEVVIAKAGKPVAKLVPINDKKQTFRFGSEKGEFVVPDDFNECDAEIEALFYGPLPE